MDPELRAHAEAARGFMPPDEGLALYEAARLGAGRAARRCSRSAATAASRRSTWAPRPRSAAPSCSPSTTIAAARRTSRAGSGTSPTWSTRRSGASTPCRSFRRTVHDAGLEASVVALVGDSPTVGRHWAIPLSLLFIDGGHGHEPGPPRLRDLDPARRARRPAGHPRRVPGPGRRRPARPSRSTPGPSTAARSPRSGPSARCGCCAGSPPASDRSSSQGDRLTSAGRTGPAGRLRPCPGRARRRSRRSRCRRHSSAPSAPPISGNRMNTQSWLERPSRPRRRRRPGCGPG